MGCLGEVLDNSLGELGVASATTQVTSENLALSNGLKDSTLNLFSLSIEAHVSQHHDAGKQQSSRVGLVQSFDIRGSAVNCLKNGGITTNVTRGSQAKTSNQTSAHIGENITIQVGHDHDGVGVNIGVLSD